MRWMNYLGIFLLLVALAGTPARSAAEQEQYQSLKRFSQIIDLIENSYVQDVDREELIQGAIQGMLKNLDPHSAYLDQDAFQEMQTETSGEFTGVGIEITLQNNRLTVVSPIEDTPAFEAGLQAGDVILEIDGESTQDISIMDAVSKIRGPKGSEVELTILPEGANSPETVTIKRDVIPVHSVKTQMLEKGYLYVRITNFNDRTTQELEEAVQGVEDLQGLVLDLRNNPGGVLDQAVSVADLFLEEGKIVYTKGKMDKAQMSFSAEDQELDLKTPMVVLINAGTASGSEIVAGALQDHKRALIVGEKSFGKGSVQTVIPLSDGAGIKLTTARYYTPQDRSIQAEGIVPDLKVPFIAPGDADQEENARHPFSVLREKDLEGHLDNSGLQEEDLETEQNEEARKMLSRDNQLRMALQLVKSLPVIKQLQ
ncbi:MAG: S41 family peptidase [Thermodesulfobacteriota bacterium]